VSNRLEENILWKGVNKMKKTRLRLMSVLAVAGIATVLFCTTALAEAPKGEETKNHRKALKEELAKELGLTEEQQAQLSETRKANQATVKDLLESLKTARTALREELEKYDSDAAKVQSLATEVKTIEAKMVDQRIASVSKIKEVLTAEQFGKMQEKAKGRMEKMKKGGKEHKRFHAQKEEL
jgi:Spy/CpxP family protein refolding chaperone